MTHTEPELLNALRAAVPGGVLTASHVFGDEMRRMVDEPARRREIDAALQDTYRDMGIGPRACTVKAALNLIGVPVGVPRLPYVALDAAETGVIGLVPFLPLTVALLAVLAVVYGLADGFVIPAGQGLVPLVVSSSRLQQANALLSLSQNATNVFGPALSGVIVAAAAFPASHRPPAPANPSASNLPNTLFIAAPPFLCSVQ